MLRGRRNQSTDGGAIFALILKLDLQLFNALLQSFDLSVGLGQCDGFVESVIIALASFLATVSTWILAIAFEAVHSTPVAGSGDLAALPGV
jgi:hypothetical protein